jgi:hypothetical protein
MESYMEAHAQDSSKRWLEAGIVIVAAVIAGLSARPFASSWNDGSRLATVESLVDRHTLIIDDSIFVKAPVARSPYAGEDSGLPAHGTLDKLFINGHYYSDKSPVPALLLAGVYQVVHWTCGLEASERPDLFCFLMTLTSSGLAYVVAVWCMYRMGAALALTAKMRLLVTASFALATVALPYVRHVNNHMLLLAVTAVIMLGLTRLAQLGESGQQPWRRVVGLGFLAGLGYTIDLGAGPVLLTGCAITVAIRCRRVAPVAAMLAAAVPWLVLHHVLNYSTGGTWKPANAVAEYLQWPGSPFTSKNMTGVVNHTLGHFCVYALALLFGKQGFIGHNLPLFLAAPAAVALLKRRVPQWPELFFAALFCGGTFFAYALTSSNSSGRCCSIRWFVPFLAPGYYVLALYLRECPGQWKPFLILSSWGALLGSIMWWHGPWILHMVPWFWPIQGAALITWLSYSLWQRRQAVSGRAANTADEQRIAA